MTTPTIPTAKVDDTVTARIDFAHVVENQIFIYGWILDLSTEVDTALVHVGEFVIDLMKQAIRLRRPDIAQHFAKKTGSDEHGFYALIDLPEDIDTVTDIRLCITLSSGKTAESRWPAWQDDSVPPAILPAYATTLKELLHDLPPAEAKCLIEFVPPALRVHTAAKAREIFPPLVQYAVDSCWLLENRILVVSGWLVDPLSCLTLVQLSVGSSLFSFLEGSLRIPRPDITVDPSLYQGTDAIRLHGFIFVEPIAAQDAKAEKAKFTLAAGQDTVRFSRSLCRTPQEAREEFLSLVNKLEPEAALQLIERVTGILESSPAERSLYAMLRLSQRQAIERLPPSLQHANPRFALHIDRAIPVADAGIFIIGWFDAEPALSLRVACHCGPIRVIISDNWIRHTRKDVTSHLQSEGIRPPNQEHGFSCYVPLFHRDALYYLSVTTPSGEVQKMRVTLAKKSESPLGTVNVLLTSFDAKHRDLRSLLDHHIGPAVRAAWASRHKHKLEPTVSHYGPRLADPPLSIIVPLYGRYDFVEYQMALFANDPEIKTVELIYVVDDPTIFDDFRNMCPDLFGLYELPFQVVFAGTNLGFAGANNLGAGVARGQYSILMNSDVVPKRPGWAGEMLRIYKTLPKPGLLGAKLLYEDGSIQHAGIAFRRYAPWGGLWINDHPLKGQSPLGLAGVFEVDAVTAACVLIDADLYRELGGLSEDYIIGDFEDSDLCLRAKAAGRTNQVALNVELYHLERQSQNRTGDLFWRANLTAYNCWLQNSRWADVIETSRNGSSFFPLTPGMDPGSATRTSPI